MRLLDLAPEWLSLEDEIGMVFRRVSARAAGGDAQDAQLTPATADGILFDCPVCHGTSRHHSIICWTPKVSQAVPPRPGRVMC